MTGRTLLLLVFAAVAAIALVVLLIPSPMFPNPSDAWKIVASDARLIGTPDAPFAYAGGDAVRSADGTATLDFDPDDEAGSLLVRITLPEDQDAALPFDAVPGEEILLRAPLAAADLMIDSPIWGSTGIGESRLPQTYALLAGSAIFDISIGDRSVTRVLTGFWSVGDALRREDGSIGQQGLIFSPLLREKTGFSNPARQELTILLYDESEGESPAVQLHVVFGSVTIAQRPEAPAP